ncbi:MAG: asparagine synthase (glutamine-hydrolyzing), partial [Candidatus Hodarchaeota archaeon]
MCGIAGFLQQNGRKVELGALRRMGDMLRHRGPDDEGYVLIDADGLPEENFEQSSGNVGFAQQRLSIIDLSPLGHQPMSNEEKTIWVNYNGEVYNFQELRKELIGKGYRFKSQSDTEVIVYAFQEWGINCVERFIGMFAIVFWDNREKKLYLVRDRLGIKPLYYYFKDGNFAFASELKALLQYPYVEKELDFEGLYHYLMFQYIPTPGTIFCNTYKLTPGHYLVVSKNDGVEEYPYWDAVDRFQSFNSAGSKIIEEEPLDELEELLISSVRYRLISDVPLGMLLSGGIDSSLVTAIM